MRWKSENGLLEVIGIYGRSKTHIAKFKVICHKCKEDTELFPLGYFVSTKKDLMGGLRPCGCGKNVRWNKEQYLTIVRRIGERKNFIVLGFAEEFHGAHTKLSLECLKDHCRWSPSIQSVVNRKSGCPKCADRPHISENDALQKCYSICKTMNYTALGFVDGYISAHKTRFEYKCPKHGIQNVSYHSFANIGTRCDGCARELGDRKSVV